MGLGLGVWRVQRGPSCYIRLRSMQECVLMHLTLGGLLCVRGGWVNFFLSHRCPTAGARLCLGGVQKGNRQEFTQGRP